MVVRVVVGPTSSWGRSGCALEDVEGDDPDILDDLDNLDNLDNPPLRVGHVLVKHLQQLHDLLLLAHDLLRIALHDPLDLVLPLLDHLLGLVAGLLQ